jgi:hypothetical protein
MNNHIPGSRIASIGRLSLVFLLTMSGCAGDKDDGVGLSTTSLSPGALYRLVRRLSGKCLDVDGARTANGTNIQQWTCHSGGAQSFRVDDLGGGKIRLVNPHSNKCVDVDGEGTANGTNIQLWTCTGGVSQSFVLEDMGGGYTHLRNPHSDKCVDVDGARNEDGTNVQLWSCNPSITSSAQAWRFTTVSDGETKCGASGGDASSSNSDAGAIGIPSGV